MWPCHLEHLWLGGRHSKAGIYSYSCCCFHHFSSIISSASSLIHYHSPGPSCLGRLSIINTSVPRLTMSHMISTDGWDLLWIPTLPPIIPTRQAATNPSAPEASEGKAANPRSNEEPVPAGEDPAPKERDPHNAALIDALKAFFVKFTKGEDPAPKEIDSHDPAVLDILKACSVGINEGGDPAPKGTGFFHDPGILNVLTACFVRFNCLSPGMAAIIYQYFTQGLGPDIDWTVLDHEKCGEVREWATQMGESLLYIEHPESPLNRFVHFATHVFLLYIMLTHTR